ncbi:MAG TPA: hypothetical protein VMU16_00965 [Candidatus Binataceae bacterium]|nr:hypothetical protein [Candidatus Binataceae bacterium]
MAVALDCFAALGLPRKLSVDAPALERAYHDLSRKVHPDRFASKPAPVRNASLSATALLTRSYRTIRDPIARGLYWLELNGEKLAEDNKRVPPELAAMVFEVQEQLEELRESAALIPQVTQRRGEIQAQIDASIAALEANFLKWDEGKPEGRPMLTLELKGILSRIAYLRTLLRDVDRALEGVKAA